MHKLHRSRSLTVPQNQAQSMQLIYCAKDIEFYSDTLSGDTVWIRCGSSAIDEIISPDSPSQSLECIDYV